MTEEWNLATEAFPSYDNSTRIELYNILLAFEASSQPSIVLNIFISFFGIFINLFHFFVLSRRLVLKSSVIRIMMGTAISDVTAMTVSISYNLLYLRIQYETVDCTPPLFVLNHYGYWISVVTYDLFRRNSTWLSVEMALMRWLVVKFGTRRKFRKVALSPFGIFICIATIFCSFPFSFAYYFRYDIVRIDGWKPDENCHELTESYIKYKIVQSKLYTENDGVFGKTFQLINGIFSKLIPCLLLPILTILLIMELRQARINQQILNISMMRAQTGSQSPATSERTTGLVVFMTISSFIIESPGGIVRVLQVFYADAGYWRMATSVNQIVNLLFSMNSSLHSFVFYLMSSQYRKTVAKILNREVPQVIIPRSTNPT